MRLYSDSGGLKTRRNNTKKEPRLKQKTLFLPTVSSSRIGFRVSKTSSPARAKQNTFLDPKLLKAGKYFFFFFPQSFLYNCVFELCQSVTLNFSLCFYISFIFFLVLFLLNLFFLSLVFNQTYIKKSFLIPKEKRLLLYIFWLIKRSKKKIPFKKGKWWKIKKLSKSPNTLTAQTQLPTKKCPLFLNPL